MKGNEFLGGTSQMVISGATGVTMATPDNTAQITAVVVQLIAFIMWLLDRKKSKKSNQ